MFIKEVNKFGFDRALNQNREKTKHGKRLQASNKYYRPLISFKNKIT